MKSFIGTYARFETVDKKEAAVLLSADNTIGDVDELTLTYVDGHHEAWMVSRFDQRLGYFDPKLSRELSVRASEGMKNLAILSLVCYTDNPEPGRYWGEAAVISYDPREEAFGPFIQGLSQKISEGLRPAVDVGPAAIEAIIAAKGDWLPKETAPLPEKEAGTVVMKKHRSLSERAIEQGRRGNKGCYVVSWAFLLGLVALIIFALHSCGLF